MPQNKKPKKEIAQDKEKEKEAKKLKKTEDFLTRSSEKSKNRNTEDPYARKYQKRNRNLSNPNPPHTHSVHQTRAQTACLIEEILPLTSTVLSLKKAAIPQRK